MLALIRVKKLPWSGFFVEIFFLESGLGELSRSFMRVEAQLRKRMFDFRL